MCLLTFFKSIETKKKQKLFKENKYTINNNTIEKKEGEKNEKENEILQNIKNFSFMNNFKLSNIPFIFNIIFLIYNNNIIII